MGFQDKLLTSYPVNMRLQSTRAEAKTVLHATIGIWLGIYAFRTYVPTAVWNLSDALPLYLKGGLAVGVHTLGLMGCILPFTRRPRAGVVLALAVATIGVLRQCWLGQELLGSALSLAGWVFWLWWLAAFAYTIQRQRTMHLATGFVVAFALQVGMQAAWHGLDLPMARGGAAILCALAINTCFAVTAMRREGAETSAHGTFAFVAVGAAFFLELTLLANVGRIGFIADIGLVPAALLIQASLICGLLLVALARVRTAVITAAAFLPLATLTVPRLHGGTVAVLFAAQMCAVLLLHASAKRENKSVIRPLLTGMIVLFVLVFTFYSRYEWPLLWIVAALILSVGARGPYHAARVPGAAWVLSAAAMVFTLAGALNVDHRTGQETADHSLSILTYNIHQGFDAAGMPAMQRIADVIAQADAEVVALQEVGRGWTFLGGADLIAYLKYRFPDYSVHYVPVNGQLWGVALMARIPLEEVAGRAFASRKRVFRYGFASATASVAGEKVRIVGVHLTAGLEGDGGSARAEQTGQLLHAVAADANVVLAGDLNAHPDEAPVTQILGNGFTDAGTVAGVEDVATWPANAPNERIDYVFIRGALRAQSGAVRRTTASDHLPVLIRLQL